MSKRKQYFEDNREMLDYLANYLNERNNSHNNNIPIEDLQIPECDKDLND